MKQNVLIDRATTPDGGEISLYCHDGDYTIRVNGCELMSTRQHHSEEILAQTICKKFQGKDIDVLVGGLGFGYTLKAVLENVSENSRVQIVELMACVIKWNQDPELPLAHAQVGDKRVTVVHEDVVKLLRGGKTRYDAIILDVDNGPEAMTTESNHSLYNKAGLQLIRSSLSPGGSVGIWSANYSPRFEQLMKASGFRTEIVQPKARPTKGSIHTIYIGVKQ